MTIEHHLRVKGLEGTSGFLSSTPFVLLTLLVYALSLPDDQWR